MCIEEVATMDDGFKEKVIHAVENDDDMMYVWSVITAEIGEAESN